MSTLFEELEEMSNAAIVHWEQRYERLKTDLIRTISANERMASEIDALEDENEALNTRLAAIERDGV